MSGEGISPNERRTVPPSRVRRAGEVEMAMELFEEMVDDDVQRNLWSLVGDRRVWPRRRLAKALELVSQ